MDIQTNYINYTIYILTLIKIDIDKIKYLSKLSIVAHICPFILRKLRFVIYTNNKFITIYNK